MPPPWLRHCERSFSAVWTTQLTVAFDRLEVVVISTDGKSGVFIHLLKPSFSWTTAEGGETEQESPAVADKPARCLRKVCTVYSAVGL